MLPLERDRVAVDRADEVPGGTVVDPTGHPHQGGVLALGCTVGQGLTGMSTLALGSLITLVFIVVGCKLALRYQLWRLERLS